MIPTKRGRGRPRKQVPMAVPRRATIASALAEAKRVARHQQRAEEDAPDLAPRQEDAPDLMNAIRFESKPNTNLLVDFDQHMFCYRISPICTYPHYQVPLT